MSMKYINSKNRAGEDVLGDYELLTFIEKLSEKYKLRTTNYQGYFVSEIVKESTFAEVTLARYVSEDAPIREIEDTCAFNDFNFISLNLYEDAEVKVKTEFRKFMYSKFGDEYLKDLKEYLNKKRDEEIQEAIVDITEQYENELDLLYTEAGLEK